MVWFALMCLDGVSFVGMDCQPQTGACCSSSGVSRMCLPCSATCIRRGKQEICTNKRRHPRAEQDERHARSRIGCSEGVQECGMAPKLGIGELQSGPRGWPEAVTARAKSLAASTPPITVHQSPPRPRRLCDLGALQLPNARGQSHLQLARDHEWRGQSMVHERYSTDSPAGLLYLQCAL